MFADEHARISAPLKKYSLFQCILFSTIVVFAIAGSYAALMQAIISRGKKTEKKVMRVDMERAPKKKEAKKTLKSIMKDNNVKVTLM